MILERKVYLGDGAYAEFQGYEILVTTENGIKTTNTVVLDPAALRTLIEFAKTHGWKV